MADLRAFDEWIDRVRSLPELAREAAPEVSADMEAEFKRQIGAATDPNGKAWEERREGGKALANAAAALTVVPVGTRVIARIKGYIARHNNGTAKGGLVRQILPGKGLPARLERTVRDAVNRAWKLHMGGGNG